MLHLRLLKVLFPGCDVLCASCVYGEIKLVMLLGNFYTSTWARELHHHGNGVGPEDDKMQNS